ncbi:MAG TPA: neutral zinc metallopeptidase [Sphingomonas sp.]|nr:neutral zinc metallopeptidase [Sphingomonas sp.]
MRLDDYRESDNVEQQRSGGSGFGGFGGGGGLGLLFGLIASRFGIGGIVVLVLGMMVFGFNPFGGTSSGPKPANVVQESAQQICAADAAHLFSCRVLANTEDTWGRIFQAQGQRYAPPRLSFYSSTGQSGCGAAQSAMGPFYCPTDQRIYLDPQFFDELQTRFNAAGDFAQAYVIAHEVGHHIQYLTGIADRVRREQQSAGEVGANALQVRMELQADCYAGVWAANAKDARGAPAMEAGDAEEGLRAATAIGDDTLQRSAGRTPVPDSFTHGTSAERVAWLKRGLESGDPARCDTFLGPIG